MSLFSADYICQECKERFNAIVEEEAKEELQDCPYCEGRGAYTVGSPRVLKASYPDGTKRKGFEDLKKVAKLEREMYDLPYHQREGIKKEIHERKKIKGAK